MSEDDDSEYSISDSLDAVGYLYPAIVDFHNRIIDGRIRLKQDPDWPTYRLSHIETLAEFLLARIIVNLHRRKLSDEEITGLLKELAEETGWTAQEIAGKLGVSCRWVLRYIPNASETARKGVESGKVTLEETLEETLEKEKELDKPFLTSNSAPSKDALEALKNALDIEKGSIQYKKSGDMIYLVVYNANNKKREWHQIGRWVYLKRLLSRTLRRKEA